MTPADFALLHVLVLHALREHALSEHETAIALAVLEHSYGNGRASAWFKRQEFLAYAARLHPKRVSEALPRLERYRILRVDRSAGAWEIEILADPLRWKAPLRLTERLQSKALEIDRWLAAVNAAGGDEQNALIPPEPSLDDALGEVARETLVATQHGPQTADPRPRPTWKRDPLPENGSEAAENALPDSGIGEFRIPEFTRENDGPVPENGSPPLNVKSLKPDYVRTLNVKSTAVAVPENGSAVVRGVDPDHQVLLARMRTALGDEQCKSHGGYWRGLADRNPRLMRVAVDAFFERNQRLNPIAEPWRWLRDRLKREAKRLGANLKLLCW